MQQQKGALRILAIDPGKTTGYCYGAFKDGKLYYHPFQSFDAVEDLWDKMQTFQPAHIVCESFEFRKNSRAGLELFSVQLIGVAHLYEALHPHDCTLYMQTAAYGKGYYTDNVLKQSGLYVRGNEHARDATRHLLQWATFGPGYKFNTSKTRDGWAFMVEKEAFDWQPSKN